MSDKFNSIDDFFESFSDYQEFFLKAIASFKDNQRTHIPSFNKVVPEYLEIRFSNTIKVPRIKIPRSEGSIIVELPGSGVSPKKKGEIRERSLLKWVALVKINEFACADEMAIRMKILKIAESKRNNSKNSSPNADSSM